MKQSQWDTTAGNKILIINQTLLQTFVELLRKCVVYFVSFLELEGSFFSLWRYSTSLGLGLPPWNSLFHFGLLNLRHLVGLLGRVISSSQGLCLYTNTEKCTYTNTEHPCPEWDECRYIQGLFIDCFFQCCNIHVSVKRLKCHVSYIIY
jgi:hypothetical protein